MSDPHFRPALLRFLSDLAANNDRDWFQENKHRYENDLRAPALRFVVDFAPRLQKISPHFLADPRPSGGALFRIYRDIRFSRDKSPYKTHCGLYFPHEKWKDVHMPGFYLHIEPRRSFVGMGSWHPDSAALKKIRARVADEPDAWRRAVSGKPFRENFRILGESLKRPPRGFEPDHPLIDVIKLKDFTCGAPLTQKQITAPGFVDEFTKLCRTGAPLVEFLCGALGVPY